MHLEDGPGARAYASYVAFGNTFHMFGGIDDEGDLHNDLWVFQIADLKWFQVTKYGPWPSARCKAAISVETDSYHSFMFGGMTEDGPVNDTWELYTLGQGATWSPVNYTGNAAPSRRHSAVASILPTHTYSDHWTEDCIVVYGGETSDHSVCSDTWRICASTLMWVQMDTRGVSPGPRTGSLSVSIAVTDEDSGVDAYAMVVTGGSGLDVLLYHPDTMAWARWDAGSTPTSLYYSAGYLHDDTVTLIGGSGANGYSPATDTMRAYAMDHCAMYGLCDTCAEQNTCGFCSQNGLCMTLDADGTGPLDGYCQDDLFRVEKGDCIDCARYNNNCRACLDEGIPPDVVSADLINADHVYGSCGYCASDNRCVEAHMGVPLYEATECPIFEGRDCADCATYGQIPDLCVDQDLCGWCMGPPDLGRPTCMLGNEIWTECLYGWQFDEASDCDQYTTCASCSLAVQGGAQCGWCQGANEGLGACISGGVLPGATDSTPWEECDSQYTGGECIDCTSFTTCDTCTDTDNDNICGWCQSTGQCVPGDGFGPFDLSTYLSAIAREDTFGNASAHSTDSVSSDYAPGYCPDWRVTGDVCYTPIERCRDQTTFDGCLLVDDCGWCGEGKKKETALCYYGGKQAPLDPDAPYSCPEWHYVQEPFSPWRLKSLTVVCISLLVIIVVVDAWVWGKRYVKLHKHDYMHLSGSTNGVEDETQAERARRLGMFWHRGGEEESEERDRDSSLAAVPGHRD
ncbi:hypothetical protein KIPB_002081 [Kipferlia bialata]|uniref:PSI domain-containing protein n=1 Tax=Kipferlia bialata TaxID=797122 RepID=A0A9K3CPV9_9EUKA|nr:hypothetical protein KIPB_002081 [Kipferlia bialata]|eukprot:g2081.t1